MLAFRPEEDRVILDMFHREGRKWGRIAEKLPGRTSASVRNRFLRIEKGQRLRDAGQSKNRCAACGEYKLGHVCPVKLQAVADPVDNAKSTTALLPLAADEPIANLPSLPTAPIPTISLATMPQSRTYPAFNKDSTEIVGSLLELQRGSSARSDCETEEAVSTATTTPPVSPLPDDDLISPSKSFFDERFPAHAVPLKKRSRMAPASITHVKRLCVEMNVVNEAPYNWRERCVEAAHLGVVRQDM